MSLTNLVPAVHPKIKYSDGPATKFKKQRLSEAQEFAAKIIDDPAYRKTLRDRAGAGTLPPAIETLLWYYRFGKPVNRVEVGTPDSLDLTELTNKELHERAKQLAEVTSILEGVA